MANQVERLMPLILIGGVLWVISRDGRMRPAPTELPGRPPTAGDNGYYPYNGGSSGGRPANVGGTIGTVSVPSRQGELGLHGHRVERETGQSVAVDVHWAQSTTNYLDEALDWPARVMVELGHSTGVLGVGGWSNMTDLLGSGGQGQDTELAASPGSHDSQVIVVMGAEPSPPQDWDVRVRLMMQGTTDTGMPDGVWSEVARGTHPDAVRSIRSVGPSVPRGWIDEPAIGVTPYGDAPAGASPPGYYTPPNFPFYQKSRYAKMRSLGMSAQRPPWGMVGHRDVRQWPVSNRNPLLPGVTIPVRQGSPIGPGRRVYAV
jgi:hypothetical protein